MGRRGLYNFLCTPHIISVYAECFAACVWSFSCTPLACAIYSCFSLILHPEIGHAAPVAPLVPKGPTLRASRAPPGECGALCRLSGAAAVGPQCFFFYWFFAFIFDPCFLLCFFFLFLRMCLPECSNAFFRVLLLLFCPLVLFPHTFVNSFTHAIHTPFIGKMTSDIKKNFFFFFCAQPWLTWYTLPHSTRDGRSIPQRNSDDRFGAWRTVRYIAYGDSKTPTGATPRVPVRAKARTVPMHLAARFVTWNTPNHPVIFLFSSPTASWGWRMGFLWRNRKVLSFVDVSYPVTK
jgi:hypothetical protein